MRLFGALANARARYNEGAMKGQQYADEQDRIRRDEARRAFEFKAQDDRLREQVRLMQQEREAARQQQEELRVAGLLQQGWEDWEGLGSDPIQGDAPFRQEAGGRVFEAPKAGAVRQTQVGARRLRFDPQRAANRETQKLFETYLTNMQMQDDRQAAAQDQARLIAALRPPPPDRTKRALFRDERGGYHYVNEGDDIPPGWTPAQRSMTPEQPRTGRQADSDRQGAEALKDIAAQMIGLSQGGGLQPPSLVARVLQNKMQEKDPGVGSAVAEALYSSKVNPQTQRIDNLRNQVAAVLLPLKGGKAITPSEERIIMGAFTNLVSSPPELRQQRLHAFELAVAPVIAKATGQPDYNQTIAEIRQRAATYAGTAGARKPFAQRLQEDGK
jgi:hypothetical protein